MRGNIYETAGEKIKMRQKVLKSGKSYLDCLAHSLFIQYQIRNFAP